MEEVASRPTMEYIPPVLPKVKQRQTTLTQITTEDNRLNINRFVATDHPNINASSMHSHVLNSKSPATTVFIAANQPDPPAVKTGSNASNGPHVVTIKINTEINKTPKISSVHLKSDVDLETFKDIVKKNNSLVRINVDENRPRIIENEEILKNDQPPYINCNAFLNSMTNVVMSSGQCSPSDTLDSGTCSDLDSTPPPLPKKKTTKSKAVSVTMIGSSKSSQGEVDFEDNDSNISCDSLNSSELSGSVHTDESHCDDACKKVKKSSTEPTVAPRMPYVTNSNDDSSFLPQGLLQDIRERSNKLNIIETESALKTDEQRPVSQNSDVNANAIKESTQLTSFRLVSQLNKEKAEEGSLVSKTPLISESTYEERKTQNQVKEQMCYSSHYFDADKYYDFHLNEKQFDDVSVPSVKSAKSGDDEIDGECFAGIKDYYISDGPSSTIKSSKGTIRGVKNRVRAGIATFLQIQSTTKSYKEKDAGKVVVYTTTMGIVRSTYQRCVLVKKILRNLLIKFEERDIFMSVEYQDEIRDRMKSDQILVPQLFIDGQHIGDADAVEKLNESGELRKMLKPYKSPDACNTCQMCGGFRLLPCRICNGSKKSLHRNHFTAEFVALKCMNCDEVGLVRCEACT